MVKAIRGFLQWFTFVRWSFIIAWRIYRKGFYPFRDAPLWVVHAFTEMDEPDEDDDERQSATVTIAIAAAKAEMKNRQTILDRIAEDWCARLEGSTHEDPVALVSEMIEKMEAQVLRERT